MIRKTAFILFCLLFVPSFASAQWNADELASLQKFQNPFPDGAVSTVWGSIRFMHIDTPWAIKGKHDVWKSPRFKSGQVDVMSWIRTDTHGNAVKAPLIISIPGIFSEYNTSHNQKIMEIFAEQGYHVLLLPNPWSVPYVKQGSQALPGDFLYEAQTALNVIKDFQDVLRGRNALGKTSIVGESYGGFLTAVTLAWDAENTHLIDGMSTMMSPPLDMLVSMNSLDTLVDTQAKEFKSLTQLDIGKIVFDFARANKEADLNTISIASAAALFAYHGINERLANTVELLEKVFSFNLMPSFKDPNDRLSWRFKYRFKDYISSYGLNVFKAYGTSDAAKISYWLGRASAAGNSRFRILGAKDDLLDIAREDIWTKMGDRTYLLPSGGHLGYLALPWFKDFFKVAFRPDLSK